MSFNNYDHYKQSIKYNLSVYLPKMTRSTADRRNKLRKLGRKLKAQLRSRPLSNTFNPTPDLRTKKSVLSLGSIRDLRIHQVSEPTPAPSIRHPSVRFTHPAVRHVISALPTPLSTAGYSVAEHSVGNASSSSAAAVDFPGQVTAASIYKRRSRVTNTVLFEEIYNQLDGVAAHPRNSQLLRRREEKRAKSQRDSLTGPRSDVQAACTPWPVEGICGTHPVQARTKSGLKALQYLSYHAPIQEEAFSDAEIFKTVDDDASREQHLQNTLDRLNGSRENIDLPARPTHRSGFYAPVEDDGPTRPSYVAFNTSRQSTLPNIPELSIGNKSKGKQPASQHSQHSLDWEAALQTVQLRTSSALRSKRPTMVESHRPDTATPTTPEFPTTKLDNLKRRTLQQSTTLDMYLATPATLAGSVTPKFPVLDQEKELRRRTILGGQQRDMALTPSTSALAVPTPLPRMFSIPRRGVGQAPKPQVNSGLPTALAVAAEPSNSCTASSTPPATLAAFVVQAAKESHEHQNFTPFGSHYALRIETPASRKPSRMALFKKIIAKTY